MKLTSQNLKGHLAKALAPIYLVSGDEVLLLSEAVDAIREKARNQDYTDRDLFVVERGFDWNSLYSSSNALSLFAEKKILEIRIPTGKPGKEGGAMLLELAENPPPDTLILVIAGKLDRSASNSKWAKAIEKHGVVVQVWPIDAQRLPGWINQRMQSVGLKPDRDGVRLLCERVEGNLLAASQEIDKLLLLNGPGPVDAQAVADAVADSARFDIFRCVDSALSGNLERALRVLWGLRAEGVEPVLLVWALGRELQGLSAMAFERDRGATLAQVTAKVWAKRKPILTAALNRHDYRSLQTLTAELSRVDRMVKGQLAGNPWDAVTALLARLANGQFKLAYADAV